MDLALGWGDRIVGLRHGEVVLDTPTRGIGKAEVMEIYGRVASTTSALAAIATELGDVLPLDEPVGVRSAGALGDQGLARGRRADGTR